MPALFFIFFAAAQKVPPALQQRLANKTRLVDIMQEVDQYYNYGRSPALGRQPNQAQGEEFENAYIHWKRFEYFHASRLDANGNIRTDINKKIWEGMRELKNTTQAKLKTSVVTNYSYGSWANYGPTSITRYGSGYNSGYGRVNCIAFDPDNENILYIGLPQGGIWKTVDNGTNWTVLTDDLPSSGISGLVVSHSNASIIYALTGDGDVSHGGLVSGYGFRQESVGVLKSVDGGANWSQTGTFPGTSGNFYGYKLIQHPINANTLFAVTTQGIFRTTNGGSTWTQEQTGIFTDIEFKPGSPNTMYAVRRMTQGGGTNFSPFFISTDGGLTWSNGGTTGLPSSAERLAIGVSAANSNYVYLLTGPNLGAGVFRGVYRSTNSGTSFTQRCSTPNILGYPTDGSDASDQTFYDLCIEVDPNDADEIITGGINIWRSTDGGTTMVNETFWKDNIAAASEYVHADIHNLTYHPNNINKVFACTDGGVGLSLNDGVDWSFPSSDLHIMASYHADWYEPNNDILASGTQDNGTNVKYGASNTYRHIYGADGFDCLIDQNNSSDIVYVGNASIIRTTDAGLTADGITPANCGTFPQLARSYSDDNDIFAGDGSSVYRSTNRGSSWTTESTPAGGRVLTTCPSNSNRVYASNGTTTWRSDNKGDTWSTINDNPGYPTGVNITDIEPRPSSSVTIWASFGGYEAGKKVYSSADSGANWVNRSGTLPNVACHSIAVDVNNTVYVGTDIGVFVRPSGETDWQPYLNGLPKSPVAELMVNNTAGTIIACTFGRGNWIDNFYDACAPSGTLVISGTLTGYRFYEYNIISTNATISGGQGTDVLMKGLGQVVLTEGFEAKAGNEFKAYLGPCGGGGIQFKVASSTDPIPMERVYLPSANGKRWPFAHFTDIDNKRQQVEIAVETAGKYVLRIANQDGTVAAVLSPGLDLTKGVHPFDVAAAANVPKGAYYIQLLKDGSIVHFQEYVPE